MSFFLETFKFGIDMVKVGLVRAEESFIVVFLGFGVVEDVYWFSEKFLNILKGFETLFVVVYSFDIVIVGVLFGFGRL